MGGMDNVIVLEFLLKNIDSLNNIYFIFKQIVIERILF